MRFLKFCVAAIAFIAVAGAASVFAFAQMAPDRHSGMDMHGTPQGRPHDMQGGMHRGTLGGMHGGMDHGMTMGQSGPDGRPSLPGQDAFGAIQEVVQMLEADPSTDWAKVNISALREHLVDMNEVTLRAAADQRTLDNGVEIAVTGEGRTLAAIKRMVPAHVAELARAGWNAKVTDLPNGVKLLVISGDPQQAAKLKALGFLGIMVQGGHHQPHHLMMARGELAPH